MLCPQCGTALADNARFCSNCGSSMPQAPSVATTPAAPPPTFQPSAYVPPVAGPSSYSGVPQTSGKAIGSLICGIINVFPLSVVAIILGHLSLSEIKKSAGRLKGQGLAIAGLVLGYLGIAFIPFILIIAAIAIPNLLRARISANESSAVGSVRNLIAAELGYSQMNSASGYTCHLSDLASAGLNDQRLLSGEKFGYRFNLQNCTREVEGGPVTKFQITASPRNNQSGVRAFCADEGGIVRTDSKGSAEDCLTSGSPLD